MHDLPMPDLVVYDLLDLPVSALSAADRAMLGAMRGWVHALTMGADPGGAAVSAFAAHPLAAAPFDRMMRALDAGSSDPLTFQRPCHDRVDDVEAVMLALWHRARVGERAAVAASLALLVDAAAAATMATAMARVVEVLSLAPAARR